MQTHADKSYFNKLLGASIRAMGFMTHREW